MISVYPYADVFESLDTISINPFTAFGPSGITVHYSANPNLKSLKREMIETKIGYHFLINKDGKIHQTSRMDYTVNHAGKAMWLKESPNRAHIAIAVLSWGRLDKEKRAWNGDVVPDAVFRNGYFWDSTTQVQEEALVTICKYMATKFKMPLNSACGHDECCIPLGRKIDPGNVMSFDMTELRGRIWG